MEFVHRYLYVLVQLSIAMIGRTVGEVSEVKSGVEMIRIRCDIWSDRSSEIT